MKKFDRSFYVYYLIESETEKIKLKVSADGLDSQTQGEKHESDRGIYTITRTNKNTAPIKLKRPNSNADTVHKY